MRSWVQFLVLPWGLFLEGEDSHGDHGLGSLVELRFKTPPGTSYSYITIHLIGKTKLHLMGVPTSQVGYTSATTWRGDHEVHKGHVVAMEGGTHTFTLYINSAKNVMSSSRAKQCNRLLSLPGSSYRWACSSELHGSSQGIYWGTNWKVSFSFTHQVLFTDFY
jgi:hypothetical protein